MRFMHRFRRPVSLLVLAGLMLSMTAAPAAGEYDPKTGRWLQRDPNGTGVVLQPGLPYHAANPTVAVSFAYQPQYGDGMNFYQFVQSNPGNRRDPAGLFSLADLGGSGAIQGDILGNYADIAASTIDALKGISLFQFERSSMIDQALGAASDPFDPTGMDDVLAIYNAYQTLTLGLFVGGVGTKLGKGVLSFGKRAFGFFANRAGSRAALNATLDAGTQSRRGFFGLQGDDVGDLPPVGFTAKMDRHHPLPKFLSGGKWQRLSRLPPDVHRELHAVLRDELSRRGFPKRLMGGPTGSTEEWIAYLQDNPGSQRLAFDATLDAARTIDRKYNTNVVHAVWNEIVKGRFNKELP